MSRREPLRGLQRELPIVALLALFAGGLALAIAWTVLDGIPHVSDGVSYFFQGKIFASGRLWLEPPAVPGLFEHENVILKDGRWCSLYPPGWPLLLALGWLLGAPWVLNPILLAVSVVGVWRLGRALFDPATGVLAAAALAVSPFALMMGAGDLAHVPALCASVWCLAFLVEGASGSGSGGANRLVLAGLLGGYAFLTRPFTAVALLAPAVLWGLWRLRGEGRLLPGVGRMAAGAAPSLALFLLYDWAVFGHPLTTGYQVYDPNRFGAVEQASLPLSWILSDRLPWYLRNLNRCLWGFPWPDLLTFLPLLWPRPGRSRDAMLAVCAVALVAGHLPYYWADVIYSGPRFAFEALGPLAVLAARSLLTVAEGGKLLLDRIPERVPESGRRSLRLAAAGLGGLLLLSFPLRGRLPQQIVHHGQWYLGQSAEPLRRAAAAGVGPNALVFVSGVPFAYSSFYLENEIPLASGGRIYVRDVAQLREAGMKAYPRREVWQAWVVLKILPEARDLTLPTELEWIRIR